MFRLVFALVASLTVSAAHAELLIELEHQMVGPDMDQVQPIEMSFRTGIESLSNAGQSLGGALLAVQEGHVYAATAGQLAAFESTLKHHQGVWESNVIGFSIVGGTADELWTHDNFPGINQWTRHVPRLGFGLTGYMLTGLTLTVDQLDWIVVGSVTHPVAQQTIRIYGSISGDFNDDGRVDAADYVAIRNGGLGADARLLWRANFSRTLSTATLVEHSVPEPSTIVLIMLAALWWRRRSRPANNC
jgi:hypothetical protein